MCHEDAGFVFWCDCFWTAALEGVLEEPWPFLPLICSVSFHHSQELGLEQCEEAGFAYQCDVSLTVTVLKEEVQWEL